jgi:aryl-alcohol dehydrogenase-like predicted oxidoreductase
VSELAVAWHATPAPLGDAVVESAIDAGVNFFATSPTYGNGASESALGRVLRGLDARPMVSTKVHVYPGRFAEMAAQVRRSVDHSRLRLGRDVLDAVFLHNRIGRERDPKADVLDVDDILVPGGVADALATLVDSGTVGAIGITGLGHSDAILEVVESKRFGLVLAYCNLLNPSATTPAHAAWRAQDYLELANRAATLGMGVIGLRPLAGGALASPGQTHPGEPELDADRVKARRFEFLVDDPAQISGLAVRFVLSQPALRAVLVGVSNRTQLNDVLAATAEGPLDDETIQAVNDSYYDLFATG